MKVLFLQNVKGLGRVGEVKQVNDGYAQNFLLPKKLVELATPEKLTKIAATKEANQVEEKIHKDLLLKELEKVSGQTLVLTRKVNSIGALFAAIHPNDIREAIKAEYKVSIPREYLHVDVEIKKTGLFTVRIGDKHLLGKEYTVSLEVKGQ